MEAISALAHVVIYLRDAAEQVQDNREECLRLADHTDALLALIRVEVERGVVVVDVDGRLRNLTS
jgi:hypothetical protein